MEEKKSKKRDSEKTEKKGTSTPDTAVKQEKSGAFDQRIIKEQIKRRPINKYRLLRRTLFTVLLAIIFGVVASVTIWLLEPVLSRMVSKNGTAEVRDEIHFIDSDEELTPQEVLSDYMIQEADLSVSEKENEVPDTSLPLTEEQIQALFLKFSLNQVNYKQMYYSMASYAREMSKSIVTVSAITSQTDFIGMTGSTSEQASGIIIAEDGVDIYVIADRSHLINAETLKVEFSNGHIADGKLRAYDASTGLALICVAISDLSSDLAKSIPLASIGSSFVMPGTPVCALGSPMGLPGSMGYGIISSSSIPLENADVSNSLFQTDIAGASGAGGFIFNFNGQVIGIIAPDQSKSEVKGLLCAYCISDLKSRISQLASGEPTKYLGIIGTVVTSEANSELGVPYGAYVLRTEMDSPAMFAGIRTGDVIVRLGDTPITSYTDYVNALQTFNVGDKITAAVMRKSQQQYVEIEYVMTARSSGEIYDLE